MQQVLVTPNSACFKYIGLSLVNVYISNRLHGCQCFLYTIFLHSAVFVRVFPQVNEEQELLM